MSVVYLTHRKGSENAVRMREYMVEIFKLVGSDGGHGQAHG
jgi:hypothetical protein